MHDIIICLFGDYYKDDRILKKADTLSKRYSVKVITVTRNKYKRIDYIKKNLVIENIHAGFIKRYYIKYFGYLFWRKIVKKNQAKVYDCNDPDTMLAGYFAKKYWNSKIIYDSHELWSDFFQKFHTTLKTFYSFFNSKISYYYERLFIKQFDRVITINEPIMNVLKKRYNYENIHLIYNFFSYIDIEMNKERQNSIVFIGRFQIGAEEILKTIHERTNLKPVVIGFKGNYKEIDYKGFLSKPEYLKELRKHKIGLFSYEVKSKNIFYATPNKVFQYLQSYLPLVIHNILGMRHFKKYKFGEFYKINDMDDLVLKVNKILENYDYYLNNIKKCKYELSWENQEKRLLRLYKFV